MPASSAKFCLCPIYDSIDFNLFSILCLSCKGVGIVWGRDLGCQIYKNFLLEGILRSFT